MKNTIILITFLFTLSTINAQTDSNKIRLSIEAGYGNRTASIGETLDPEFKEYLESLLSGLNINAHLSYFIKPNLGIGIVYSGFSTKKETSFTSAFNGDLRSFKANIGITYIAPEFLYRYTSTNDKHSLIGAASVGYLKYKNDSTSDTIDFENSGSSIGFGFGLSYDYHISPSIAIGVGANFISGSLDKLSVTSNGETSEFDLLEEDKIELSRLNLGGGVRFYF